MTGRKAIPNAIKRAISKNGKDSGDRPIPQEPQAAPGPPRIPDDIKDNPDAIAAWKQFVKELAPMDVLTKADRATLTLLCVTWALVVNDARKLGNQSVIKWPNGQPGTSPYLKSYHQNAALCLRLLSEFGLSPSSRSRIQLPKPAAAAEADDFSDLD